MKILIRQKLRSDQADSCDLHSQKAISGNNRKQKNDDEFSLVVFLESDLQRNETEGDIQIWKEKGRI
jgi:hypothetical protein